jgi:hypothetical protein
MKEKMISESIKLIKCKLNKLVFKSSKNKDGKNMIWINNNNNLSDIRLKERFKKLKEIISNHNKVKIIMESYGKRIN